jgi:uncharacterized protein
MNIITTIRDFVEKECKKPTSLYGYEPFPYHFKPVAEYAEKLADTLGGDKEVILISAWIHDIGSIIHGRDNHHITGAEIAEKKLRELTYPEEKIVQVKNCILHHRGSHEAPRESIEEKILVEADVMSAFDNIGGLYKAAILYEKLSQIEATASVMNKLERKWNQLHFEKSKEIIRPKYEAAKILLGTFS